ncbi:Spy/CpxP family protein refolding chaperone [Oceanidesulfovibrio marinus]|uniref:Periplasmic heavy metal sensor n=1 Tax=Oceanidesulfovibrio marinus TaxID=370038 RepID=A0ABX6NHL0_9BACT|nr:periplasmic heavy metal sensor [Oceanidesulfovibrio marinus]QJT10113.1 periplasmic heavy metal sensor [Oceanidesulfovibrio marinus]
MRRTLFIPLAIMAILVVAAIAQAQPDQTPPAAQQYGCPYAKGTAAGPLSPEKQEAVQKAFDEFQDKMEPLRDDMWAYHTELDALSQAGADQKTITDLVEKMREVRKQMYAQRTDLRAKLDAIGVPGGFGRGCGGPGFGPGMMGQRGGCGGYGPGMMGSRGGPGMRGPHHGRGGGYGMMGPRGGCGGYGPGGCGAY